jgi:NAD(P)-dependent dehydrogenase (short-subunit alcohol dehydrogenase family)
MRLAGQVGLVTGAASGIGESVARRLVEEGATIMCLDINDAGSVADSISSNGGGQAEALIMDVRSARGWRDVVASVAGRHGQINFLINVAGIPVMDPGVVDTIATLTEEWWDKVLDTNLKGTWLGMREVIPHLKRAGGGRIVNISSLAGSRGLPSLAAYSASKGGVDALTRQAAAEYAADGILINAISPGTIKTPLLAAQTEEWQQTMAQVHMIHRIGDPSEIGSMVAYLLAEGSFVTGSVFSVDGGWAAKG